MNKKETDWNSIKWNTVEKIEYRYGDRSVPPRYHRSYTIIITNKNKSIVIDSYGRILRSRSYPNNQEDFDKLKNALAKTGIYTHEDVIDRRCGITTLSLKLFDKSESLFSGHTTGTEGRYGNIFLPDESIRLIHDEIPESIGDMIHETREQEEKAIEVEEERRRPEEEARLKSDIEMRLSKYGTIFEALSQNMVYVEGGTFYMGDDNEEAYEDEKPIHKVTLSSFYICRYEVTQELWLAVMDNNPSHFKGDNRPVEQVSRNDCEKFIRKLNQLTRKNFRLPTEAEWEYAARGGNKSTGYKYSGSDDIDDVAWYSKNTNDKETHPVGQKRPNELGLYDMSGNVREWCMDRYACYNSSEQINPKGDENGSNYVYRGGCFSSEARNCRVSRRDHWWPTFQYFYLGFRLAL